MKLSDSFITIFENTIKDHYKDNYIYLEKGMKLSILKKY